MWSPTKTVLTATILLFSQERYTKDQSDGCPVACECSSGWLHDGLTVDCSGRNLHAIPQPLHKNTHTLLLDRNRLTDASLEWLRVVELTELSHLNLSNNNIQRVNACIFDLAFHNVLNVLDISRNRLTAVPAHLPHSIQHLYLAHNQIQKVNFSSLMHNQYLQTLDLKDNIIDEVYSESQDVMFGDLHLLVLSGNNVGHHTLSMIDWTQFPSLESLLLNNNRIHVMSSTEDMPLPNLKTLDLSGNEMMYYTGNNFMSMPSLTTLRLHHNNLTDIPQNIMSIKELDMSYNRIRTVNSQHQYIFHIADTVNLLHNQLHCDCDLLWLKALLQDHYSKLSTHDPTKTAPICSSPKHVEGRLIHTLSASDLQCHQETWNQENLLSTWRSTGLLKKNRVADVIWSLVAMAASSIVILVYASAKSLDRKMSGTSICIQGNL